MKLILCFALLAIIALSSTQIRKDEPNESCSWKGMHICPIESSGSYPVCDSTNPTEVAPGIFAMKICAAETPKAIGGKFDVGVVIYGTILTVDVIPTG